MSYELQERYVLKLRVANSSAIVMIALFEDLPMDVLNGSMDVSVKGQSDVESPWFVCKVLV